MKYLIQTGLVTLAMIAGILAAQSCAKASPYEDCLLNPRTTIFQCQQYDPTYQLPGSYVGGSYAPCLGDPASMASPYCNRNGE